MHKKVERCVRGLVLAGLCVAGGAFMLYGFAPAAVPVYVISASMCGLVILPYVCVVMGLVLAAAGILPVMYAWDNPIPGINYSADRVCEKYILVLTFTMIMAKAVSVKRARHGSDSWTVSGTWIMVCAAIMTVAANMAAYTDRLIYGFVGGVAEAVVCICLYNIMKPGFDILTRNSDGERLPVEDRYDFNQAMISILFMVYMCLWVVPGDVYQGLNIMLMAGLVILLWTIRLSGAAYGFGVAFIVGGINALKEQRGEWMFWTLLLTLVMLIGSALAGRKKVIIAIFYVTGVGLATFAGGIWPHGRICGVMYLLDMLVPLVIFVLMPYLVLQGLYSVDRKVGYAQAAATEMNRLTMAKMEDMANTFRRLDYTFAGSDGPGISLGQVGDLVEGFRTQIGRIGEARDLADERLEDKLKAIGMEEVSVSVLADTSGRNRYYVAGRTRGEGMILSRQVAELLSAYFGRNIRAGMNSPSLFFDEYRSAEYEECASFRCRYHVRRIKKCGSPVSGDNFSIREYEDGRLVMMLSDGMGSGSLASCESCMMLDTMEEMLEAGFAPEYSISFANNCMSRRNEGRTFTTFDMAVIDMYDGVLRSYKQGAAVTYIVSPGDDGNGLEIITSTTLPVGVLDEADCDEKEVQLAAGDAVVMISDGITDMDDDDRMTDILKKIYIGDSKKMVDEILGGMIGKEDAYMRDDITVMVAVVEKSENSIKYL